jgi:hypothetical protein
VVIGNFQDFDGDTFGSHTISFIQFMNHPILLYYCIPTDRIVQLCNCHSPINRRISPVNSKAIAFILQFMNRTKLPYPSGEPVLGCITSKYILYPTGQGRQHSICPELTYHTTCGCTAPGFGSLRSKVRLGFRVECNAKAPKKEGVSAVLILAQYTCTAKY